MSDEKVASNPIFAIVVMIGVAVGLLPFSLFANKSASETSKGTAGSSARNDVICVDVHAPIKQDLGSDFSKECECNCIDVKYVIALIPDPETDGQASTYDEFLSTIEHAAADSGHTFVGYSLPNWRHEKTPGSGKPRSSFRAVGSAVFRRNQDVKRGYDYLVTLLILESPIRGISLQAFGDAIELIRSPRKGFETCGAQPIRVIGPCYSGTQHTLEKGIGQAHERWKSNWPGVCVVTGSATTMKIVEPQLPRVTWHRTVHSVEDVLVNGMLSGYLGASPADLVIFAESETSFGSSASGLESRVIVFPRQIAAVRSAYLRRLGSEEIKKSPFSSDRHLTNLDLTSDIPSPDIPPAASLKTSPVVNELVVRRLMDDLAVTRAPYVAIIATDCRDTIFLAELVKRTLPNTQLILIEPNILFARPEVAGFLRGTLVASTYPLASFAQQWTTPTAANLPSQFASDAQQGTFNATLAQLCSNRLRDYRSIFWFEDFLPNSFAPPPTPPVWISVIGRDGFWPVATINPKMNAEPQPTLLRRTDLKKELLWCHDEMQTSAPAEKDIRYSVVLPGEFWTLIATFTALGLASVFITLTTDPANRLETSYSVMARFGQEGHAFRPQRLLLLVFMTLFAICFVHLFVHAWNDFFATESSGWLSIFGFIPVMIVFILTVWFIAPQLRHTFKADFTESSPSVLFAIAAAVSTIVTAWFAAPWILPCSPVFIFLQRNMSMLNGVSLLLPVTILIGLLSLRFYIKAYSAMENVDDIDPPVRFIDPCASSIKTDRISLSWLSAGALLALIASTWMAAHWVLPLPSILTLVFLAVFPFVLMHAWQLSLRTLMRWNRFAATLTHVGTMPFLSAFDRLPQQFTARLGLYLDRRQQGDWMAKIRETLAKRVADLEVGVMPYGALIEPEPPGWQQECWDTRDPLQHLRHGKETELAELDKKRTISFASEHWADDVFAIDVIARLNWMARRVKFGLVELLYTLIGLLLVVCSFPVPGQVYWIALFVTWLAVVGFGFIWIVLYCERDEVLSRIANTQPNRLSWSSEMIKSLAAYLIPVTLAIMSVFPEVYESIIVMFAPLWTMFVRN